MVAGEKATSGKCWQHKHRHPNLDSPVPKRAGHRGVCLQSLRWRGSDRRVPGVHGSSLAGLGKWVNCRAQCDPVLEKKKGG